MSTQNVFDKKLSSETTMDKVEGLLEHFNLPPKTIDFIRENKRTIQLIIAIIIGAVVIWSLYGSYLEKQEEEAASALSLALSSDETTRYDALQEVSKQYKKDSSGLWATLEMGHLSMQQGKFDEAQKLYSVVEKEIEQDSPLYPLIIFGKGQAFEAKKAFKDADKQYIALQDIPGFEQIGYFSRGRLEEAQENYDKAIAIYNNYLLTVGDSPNYAQVKDQITNKIARLKAIK